MIKSFTDRETRRLFETGRSRRFPTDLGRRALYRLEQLDHAHQLCDLALPPGNRLHPLKGDREGRYSISVSGQWRICFIFNRGDAYEVELIDYH